MHELSIAMSILDMAEAEAERRSARVLGIHLKLGVLSGVVKEALLSAFDLARQGGVLEDTRLLIEEVPIQVNCKGCNTMRPVVSMQQLCCAECGMPALEVASGRELEVVALEIQ
jgi:hydrogenase nickel incorporation protein HypA/HybF